LELTFLRHCPLTIYTAAFVRSPRGRFISYCAKRGERITFLAFIPFTVYLSDAFVHLEFVNNATRGDDPERFIRSCRRYNRAC